MNPEKVAFSPSLARKITRLATRPPQLGVLLGALRFENPALHVAGRGRRTRAFPGLVARGSDRARPIDRIRAGESSRRTVTSPLAVALPNSRGRSLPFRSFVPTTKAHGDADVPRQNIRRARDNLANGRERTHVARLICRCHASGLHTAMHRRQQVPGKELGIQVPLLPATSLRDRAIRFRNFRGAAPAPVCAVARRSTGCRANSGPTFHTACIR